MQRDLQQIAETLADRLGRSVLVGDRSFNLLAHSSPLDTFDEVRRRSILERHGPNDAVAWVRTLGVDRAREPLRLPANADYGMEARLCVPIWMNDVPLGYIWLIEGDGIDEPDRDAVAAAASAAGGILYRDHLLSGLRSGRARELLRDLIATDPDLRRHAADSLTEEELFAGSSGIQVVVVAPVTGDGRPMDEEVELALAAGLRAVTRSVLDGSAIDLVRPRHGIVLLATSDPAIRSRDAVAVGERVRDDVLRALAPLRAPPRVIAGVGTRHPDVAGARTSYEEARRAVQVAEVIDAVGDVVVYEQLGVFRMLSQLPVENLDDTFLHPGLRRLAEHRDGDALVETLEVFLDLAGDATAAADQLRLHRSSLYKRLRRIEEVAGIDLDDGGDRLALHLSVKVARLAGLALTSNPRP
ncbi:MAG TPA: helix-turn-helix domain-containing protein [Nitriliruptorales bacterium]